MACRMIDEMIWLQTNTIVAQPTAGLTKTSLRWCTMFISMSFNYWSDTLYKDACERDICGNDDDDDDGVWVAV